MTSYGVLTRWIIANTFIELKVNPGNDDPNYTGPLPAWTVRPQYCVYMSSAADPLANSDNNTFITPVLEGATVAGLRIANGWGNQFFGGVIEEQRESGVGVILDPLAILNSFVGVDVEFNSPALVDWVIYGKQNTLVGCIGNGSLTVKSGALANTIKSHRHVNSGLVIEAGANYTTLENVGVETYADGGSNTYAVNVYQPSTGFPLSAVVQSRQFAVKGANGSRVYIEAPNVTFEHQLTLPGSQGAAQTLLLNDGAGNLSWAGALTWTTATYENSWAAVDNNVYPDAGYTKRANVVTLRGYVAGGTVGGGAAIFTLPSGHRPNKHLVFTVLANGAVGRLDVYTTGKVELVSGSNAAVSLNGISFDVP